MMQRITREGAGKCPNKIQELGIQIQTFKTDFQIVDLKITFEVWKLREKGPQKMFVLFKDSSFH